MAQTATGGGIARDRKLVNKNEAKAVRMIFIRYPALGSVGICCPRPPEYLLERPWASHWILFNRVRRIVHNHVADLAGAAATVASKAFYNCPHT